MKTYWANQFSKTLSTVLQNPGVPVPSNEMGNAKPVFNPSQASNAQYVFGTPEERAKSMPQREITPLAKLDEMHNGKTRLVQKEDFKQS